MAIFFVFVPNLLNLYRSTFLHILLQWNTKETKSEMNFEEEKKN